MLCGAIHFCRVSVHVSCLRHAPKLIYWGFSDLDDKSRASPEQVLKGDIYVSQKDRAPESRSLTLVVTLFGVAVESDLLSTRIIDDVVVSL